MKTINTNKKNKGDDSIMASFSSLSRVLGCERKAILSRRFREFTPKSEALVFGSAYHNAIEHGLQAGIDTLREDGMAVEKNVSLLTEMITRIETLFIDNEINITGNEIRFDLDIEGTNEKFIGYIDAIADYKGEQWLVEFKSAAAIDASMINMDGQVTSYLYAARELGIDAAGVIYIINAKKKEKEVTPLKKGGLSISKAQGVTYASYVDAARETYGDDIPQKVLDFMDWLKDNEKPLIVSVETKRTDAQLDVFGETLKSMVKREEELNSRVVGKGVVEALREAHAMPSKFGCGYCEFKNQCLELITNDGEYCDDDLNGDFIEVTNGEA